MLRPRKPKAMPRRRARVLVSGPRKNGKSTGLATFKNMLHIDPENGAFEPQYQELMQAAGSEYVGVEEGARDCNGIIETLKTYARSGKIPYWGIAFDSLSKLFDTQVAFDLDKMASKGKDISEGTFGAEKKGATGFVRRLVVMADLLDVNLFLVCHEKEKWTDGKVVGYTFDGPAKLDYELDLHLRVVNRKAIVEATRYKEFPLGLSFDWNYSEFIKRFGNHYEDAPSVAKLATDEQVALLSNLLKVRADSQQLTDKWLLATGSETFADMKADDAQKCIDYLQAKPTPAKEKA